MIKHYNITVTGKVQGVWYRKSTWQKAEELKIKGYVMNQPNGSVYIEAEGTESQLKTLLDWCSKGPEFAIVQQVSFEVSSVCFFENFEILY
ncbi:acylphosphatase [Aquimarina sp. 2201CG5-10]|uniref:acylphosphatase n=1 Tax=Aquimarina callyspongiae TaxID=3098150 RepID=UPI002AB54850|nr:acylphosphatase [Aquimarina sp. 2201CG5-10]MDY8134949.1 acylphosphatase [Aquimarina sp. 2201CG5-10]